jgi:hypothetical protein
MSKEKYIIQCEKCKKPILKNNPINKRPEQMMVLDCVSNEPVCLPNVYCKHCKHLNLITEKSIIWTSDLKPQEKKDLDKKIKKDILE